MKLTHYKLLAEVFQYPDETLPERIESICAFFRKSFPEAGKELDAFRHHLPGHDVYEMQELFVRTFDVQAITTLDIGYVLFGDDYKRGELLANLTREHRIVANNCGTELADHLPNILQLIAKLEKASAHELVQELLAPAIDKMISEFDPHRIAKKDELYKKHYKTLIEFSEKRESLYLHALEALRHMINHDFNPERKTESLPTTDFLSSLGREIEIEHSTKH